MLQSKWKSGSLRFWIGVGMVITVLPLLLTTVLHHTIMVRSVIGDFQDVAARHREQLLPAQQLQLSLWESTDPIDLFLIGGDQAQAQAYRQIREQIKARFARLHGALANEAEARTLVERAREDWTAADRIASRVLATGVPGHVTAATVGKEFEASIAAAVDRLGAVHLDLATKVDRDYLDAGRSVEHADWIAAIAGAVSLVSMFAGIALIGYMLSRSVDRLVDGATRFAAGEREHRIAVHVPPELQRVAEEFNHMAVRIQESELFLADLARRDRLTGLLNRRALDEMLTDALARHERLNEGVAVIVVDIDYFKRVNDTHGHAAGDEVLRLVSGRLSATIREIDRAFRFGGEEFVVVLSNADRAAAEAAAERIRAAVAERPITIGGVDVPVTISAGIATTADSGNAEGLLNAADAALYCAKSTGRNRVVWVGAMA